MYSSSVLSLTEFKIADLEKEGKDIKGISFRLGFLGSGVGKEIDRDSKSKYFLCSCAGLWSNFNLALILPYFFWLYGRISSRNICFEFHCFFLLSYLKVKFYHVAWSTPTC